MDLVAALRHAFTLPPGECIQRVVGRLHRRTVALRESWRDARQPTYASDSCVCAPLQRFFTLPTIESLRDRTDLIRRVTDLYLNHQFDLLGSGWVRVEYGAECTGLAGYRYPPGARVQPDSTGEWLRGRVTSHNLPMAQAVWRLVGGGYRPIDWHLDFKSGFRWSPTTRSAAIRYGDQPGVDVKVPWELARMQHLSQLSWAFLLATSHEARFQPAAIYAEEFENQVLDFIATNPPRFGVNWSCTMDVAIRVSNWLVAYDLLTAAGWRFRSEFERVFARSVYEHGRHIVSHLEWHPVIRSNHYLANIAGLLFTAAYLPDGDESRNWLSFALRELVHEVNCQFTPDGANFEASTSYHRLSAEMVLYSTAIVSKLPAKRIDQLKRDSCKWIGYRPGPKSPALNWLWSARFQRESPFPEWYGDRLERMAVFTTAIMRPDGSVVQIGDNDSGRFLKLWPTWRSGAMIDRIESGEPNTAPCTIAGSSLAETLTERAQDHRHLLAAARGLLNATPEPSNEFCHVEESLVRDLVWGDATKASTPCVAARQFVFPDLARSQRVTQSEGACDHRTSLSALVPEWHDGLQSFDDFGLFVYRRAPIMVSVRCGPVGQNGNGGHAHNDQLSFELMIEGIPVVVDPGTYVYTPLPHERNRFRSTDAHATLSVEGKEQIAWESGTAGLFSLRTPIHTFVRKATEHEIIAEHSGFGLPHRRAFRITATGIEAVDECAASGLKSVSFPLAPGVTILKVDERNGVTLGLPTYRATQTKIRFLTESTVFSRWTVVESSYSPSYGQVVPARTCRLTSQHDRIAWRIEIVADDA